MMSIAFLASHGDAGLGTSRGMSSAVAMTNTGHGGPNRSLAPTKPPSSVIPPLTLQRPITDVDDEEEDDYFIGSAATSRPPRSPRPSYSEEQKFFIMFARIMQDKGWLEIENDFARIWGQRTKGGLTSVYYRIRKSWNLDDVLKSGGSSPDKDRKAVADKAGHCSRAFLVKIGYLKDP